MFAYLGRQIGVNVVVLRLTIDVAVVGFQADKLV